MAAMYKSILKNYEAIVAESIHNPGVDSWPLMASPYPVLGIAATYLLFVLSLGPRLMKNREPVELKLVIAGYNAYQVLFSLWLATMPFRGGALQHFAANGCGQVAVSAVPSVISHATWWYLASKIVELLDTVFFVLRKKQSQVTFLHVYHHTFVTLFTWLFLKHLFVEHGIVVVVVNSLVHVAMYSYYLLAALGPALWWKKYITWIQLAQFLVLLSYVVSLVVFDCKLPRAVTFIAGANLVIFIVLFTQFYRRAYRKVPPRDQPLARDASDKHRDEASNGHLKKLN